MNAVITTWTPEETEFWEQDGRKTARRNLWISIPALFLAFAVWMVWSVVVVNLPKVGFNFSTEQLFWLTALPGLSGAALRVFYSFMVPIFGGRRWTAMSTASLLIPAIGIGMAVQDSSTSYGMFLILALLCGFGGGNFASSMANIAYFFPKKEKGNALALNAGLGNLGVSAVQFLVPIVITFGIFGSLGGAAQMADGKTIWLQNAAFFWVPLIVISSVAAWFGMNDIADAKASLASQLAILKREAGNFAAAEDLYRQALAVWPYHPESHRNLGILYDLYLGREAEALAHYRAYRQLLQEEDRQLESWIADLERRLGAQASGG